MEDAARGRLRRLRRPLLLGPPPRPLAAQAPAGQCAQCGYDLRGNVSGVCPECGGLTNGRSIRAAFPGAVAQGIPPRGRYSRTCRGGRSPVIACVTPHPHAPGARRNVEGDRNDALPARHIRLGRGAGLVGPRGGRRRSTRRSLAHPAAFEAEETTIGETDCDPKVGTHRSRLASFPLWSPAVLFAVAPALWVRRRVRQGRRARAGPCRRCGYDLRAMPHGCPECVTVVGSEHAA